MKATPRRAAALALLLLLSRPPVAAAQVEGKPASPEPGLQLSEVLALAEARNPMLGALRSAATAAGARQPEASTLPDPMLQLGIMNFGLPSFNTDMPTSMVPSVQLMQMVPFPGKLGLKGEIAAYSTAMADASARETSWLVRREAATLFFGLYALDHQIDVMRETLSLLDDFREVANAMYVSGTGHQADVLRADVEVARMDGEIRRMEAMRAADAAELNAVLDRPASTPVPTPLLGALPLDLPDGETLHLWALDSRPAVERGRLALEQASVQQRLTRKEIWPDITFGLSYGQRNIGMGTERMGSAMVEFSLPVHAGSRQLAMRREAAAMEEMARSDLRAIEAALDASIDIQLADLGRARVLTDLYGDEVIPEARATVESALSSYRVGSVDFMTLVDAQMTVNRYEGEFYQLLADYGRAIATMESLIGRELPRSGPLLRELP